MDLSVQNASLLNTLWTDQSHCFLLFCRAACTLCCVVGTLFVMEMTVTSNNCLKMLPHTNTVVKVTEYERACTPASTHSSPGMAYCLSLTFLCIWWKAGMKGPHVQVTNLQMWSCFFVPSHAGDSGDSCARLDLLLISHMAEMCAHINKHMKWQV